MMTNNRLQSLGAVAVLLFWSGTSLAESEEERRFWGSSRSADEIAQELVSPAGQLFSAANNFTHRPMQGSMPTADDQENLIYALEVVWPWVLDNGKTLRLRANFPFNLDLPTYYLRDGSFNNQEFIEWRIRQEADEIPRDGEFFDVHDHIYDIDYSLTYGGVSDSGFIAMYGIAGVMPNSQDGTVERDSYMLGPEVSFGKQSDRYLYGVTASHLFGVASASDRLKQYDHNMTIVKLFFHWGLGNGWAIISNPVIEYDWEADSDNKLLLPLGGGISKTFKIGRIPFKTDLELQYYVESPDAFGPDWTLRFGITPVLSDRRR